MISQNDHKMTLTHYKIPLINPNYAEEIRMPNTANLHILQKKSYHKPLSDTIQAVQKNFKAHLKCQNGQECFTLNKFNNIIRVFNLDGDKKMRSDKR